MRLCLYFFAILSVLNSAVAVFSQGTSANYVTNEVLVKFSAGAEAGKAKTKLAREGLVVKERFSDSAWQLIKIPSGLSVEKTLRRYAGEAGIEAVQPNFYYRLLATPNDTSFSQANMYGLFNISAPQAWDLSTGSPAIVVANIDTGTRYTHQDLAANMWTNSGETAGNGIDDDSNGFIDDYYGYDFFFNDPDPLDEHGHGTHTAGTIGAVGNNGLGVVGVAWNVKIMTIKIYNASGMGSTSAMLVNAYNYIRMMKNRGVNIRVTNNAYGGCDEACGYDQATKDALDAMGDAGIVNVFAAGNDGLNTDTQPQYPGSYTSPSVISVAASTAADAKAGFSNFGIESVDLAAPGTGILSTTRGSDSSYGVSTGTSMSTPHVTGTAALLAAYHSDLSAASIKATILNSVDALGNWKGLVKTSGRLNAHRALQSPTTCAFALSRETVNVGTKGGYFSIDIAAAENCDFSVKDDVNWIFIEGGVVRSGGGTIRFRVTVSPTPIRTGVITVAGKTLTVTQRRGRNF
ncbi:MAG: S8 family serine peptidase [Pyrinomonadaceae bacterium]